MNDINIYGILTEMIEFYEDEAFVRTEKEKFRGYSDLFNVNDPLNIDEKSEE